MSFRQTLTFVLDAGDASRTMAGMIRAANTIMRGCRPLTDVEIARVAGAFSDRHGGRDLALFMLGLTTGFRISELLSLTVGDVRPKGRFVRWVQVRRRHTKGGREGRRMPLHQRARAALARWLAQHPDPANRDAPLFASRKAGAEGLPRAISATQASRLFVDAYAAAEVHGHVATHSMRKTLAKKTHEANGGDIFRTQQVLGHRNLNSTVSYLEGMADEDLEEAVAGLHFGEIGPLFDGSADPAR